MNNLWSYVSTQNLNNFFVLCQAINLNDDQFEINDIFLNTVSKNLYQCNCFDIHSQCFQIPKKFTFFVSCKQ